MVHNEEWYEKCASELELLPPNSTKQSQNYGTPIGFGRPRAFMFHVEHS
jgi:hypothetical protein